MDFVHPLFMPINMTCYAVLWIPTILHGELSNCKSKIEKLISDVTGDKLNEGDEEIYVRVILGDSGNVDVYVRDADGQFAPDPFITLTLEDSSSNGLCCYSYTKTALDSQYSEGFGFTESKFPKAIYHIIKEFYHSHDFHNPENDASLPPFVSTKKIDIHSDDNDALKHYLIHYEKLLCSIAAFMHLWLDIIRTKLNISRQSADLQDDSFQAFTEMCLKARGYEAYMGTLYRSIHNKKCRLDAKVRSKKDSSLRKIAFNIENALQYIRTAEYEFISRYKQTSAIVLQKHAERNITATQTSASRSIQAIEEKAGASIDAVNESSKSSTRGAIAGILVSFFLGIASLLYSAYAAYESSKDLSSVKVEVDAALDSLAMVVGELKEHQEVTTKSIPDMEDFEELNRTILGIEKRLKEIGRILKKADQKE